MKPIRIAVDFDGTIVKHEYPEIGPLVPGALRVLHRLQRVPGVTLLLWTMRSDKKEQRACLQEAGIFCLQHELAFKHINDDPHQRVWTDSPKLYAAYYIDDAAVGCPLIVEPGARPFVDWAAIEQYFEKEGILQPDPELHQ